LTDVVLVGKILKFSFRLKPGTSLKLLYYYNINFIV